MGQRAVNEKIALFVHQLGRHRRQPSAVKEVHEKGLEDVVPVVAQHDGGAALFTRDPVQVAAPQTRTERAEGAARGHLVDHDGIGVLILDPVRNPHFFKEFRQHGGRKAGLALIEVAGQ